jgi:hypothetical protein
MHYLIWMLTGCAVLCWVWLRLSHTSPMRSEAAMDHETCNCHECTQARWKMSLQGQLETTLRNNPFIQPGTPPSSPLPQYGPPYVPSQGPTC